MSDLAKWNIHGSVQTLRTEFAEWDLSTQEWQAPRHFTVVRFLPNGSVSESEVHNPDGSISRSSYSYDGMGRMKEARFGMNGGPISKTLHFYDDSGRLIRILSVDQDGIERELEAYSYGQDGKRTKVYFVPKLGPNTGFVYAIEGTEQSYGADGVTTAVTIYDDGGQPDEVLLYDAERRLLRRVVFTRDSAGRLMREDLHLGEQFPFPDVQKELESATPKAREAAAMWTNLFGPSSIMSRTTYDYDPKGHLLERHTRMGELGQDRTNFRYDDHDNPIEETMEHNSREMHIDEEGNLHLVKESSHRQNVRFEYRYDTQGNWTERVVWIRLEPNPDFQRSNVERREIVYYAGSQTSDTSLVNEG